MAKATALSLSVLALFAGVILVGGPFVSEVQAATNQPEMDVESVELSQSEIETGDSVEVTAVVENDGEVEGELTATLEADGEQRDSETVELAPEEQETVSFEEQFDEAGTYGITVNGEQIQELTVLDPGELLIRFSDTYYTELEIGDSLSYFVSVRNVGDKNGPFTVELTANGRTVSEEQLRVPGGGIESLSLTYVPELPGTYDMQIETDADVADAGVVQVTEPAEPEFEVSGASVSDDRIEAGQSTLITADVENVGDAAGTYEADLFVNGNAVDSTQVSLDSGESTTVEFRPTFSDPGEYDVRVDDAEAGTVTVLRPAQFELSDAQLSADRIVTGNSVRATATVENTGDVEGTFPARLKIDGEDVNSTLYRVAGGDSRPVTFDYRFEDPGEYTVDINNERAGTVTVLRPADLTITEARTNSDEVRPGDTVRTTATVVNFGDVAGERTLNLVVDGRVVESTDVTLPGGELKEVTFTRQFETPGERNVAVNDVSAGTVSVLAPANFAVTDAGVSKDEPLVGEQISVEASVENTGDISGATSVDLAVDGNVVESTGVTVDGRESKTVEFTRAFETRGERSVAVNDVSAGTVSVLAPANLAVTDAEVSKDEVLVGEQLSVQASVQNTGDVSGETTVELAVDGNVVESTEVTVDGRESKPVEFTRTFDEAGETALSINGVSAGQVSVLAPAAFEITSTVVSNETVLTTETVSVTADVKNTGDVEGTYDAVLQVDSQQVESTAVTVGGGESRTASFSHQFDSAGEYSLSVGDATAGTVTALRPADLSVVSADTARNETTTDQPLTVEATIENSGDVSGEQMVDLEVNGSRVEQETVTLDGGERTTVNFSYQFDSTGEVRVAVNGVPAGEVVALAPAEFEISDASIARQSVLPGEATTISAEVENPGDVDGEFDAQLRVQRDTVAVNTVEIGAGESKQVTFSQSFTEVGTSRVSIGGVPAGEVVVEQPPTLTVTSTGVNETTILENNTVGIDAEIRNTGDRDGTFTVNLQVDGEVVAQQTVPTPAGSTRSVSFTQRFPDSGEYELSIGDAPVETVTVDQPAEFELTDTAVNTSAVLVGDAVEVVATVANDGDRDGTYEIAVAVEGETVTTRQVTVSAQGTRTVRASHTFETPGEYSVAVNDLPAGTVEVDEQPDIEVNRAAVPADWVAQGEATKVRTVVENPGEWTTTRTVTVTVDEDQVAAKSVTLEPGEQRQVEIEFEANNGTVEVNGVEAGTIESSEFFEESPSEDQTQTGGGDFYPILTLVLVLAIVVVGWFVLSVTGVFNRLG